MLTALEEKEVVASCQVGFPLTKDFASGLHKVGLTLSKMESQVVKKHLQRKPGAVVPNGIHGDRN